MAEEDSNNIIGVYLCQEWIGGGGGCEKPSKFQNTGGAKHPT